MDRLFLLKTDVLPHITYIGMNDVPECFKHFKRTTNEYILYFITSGSMSLTEADRQYHLSAGDVILLEPFLEHKGYKEDSCCYFYVHFSDFPVSDIVEETSEWAESYAGKLSQINYHESFLSNALYSDVPFVLPKYLHLSHPAAVYQMTHLFHEAISGSLSKELYYKTSASRCIMEMIQLLSTGWLESAINTAHPEIPAETSGKLDQLMHYLHTSYHEKITSQTLEEIIAMNFDYLNRLFKKRTGTTIFTYLNQIRLDQSRQLLVTTQLPLKEIASQTGFSDVYYFSRFFKKHTGITPAQYRK